ncbi:MAG TPA: hypothetical protein VIK47_00675 [Kiloniellales bacterium]
MLAEPSTSDTAAATSGLRDILALVTGGRTRLQVGDIKLDEDGRVRMRSGDDPLRFCFAYRGVDFDAHIVTAPDASVILSSELGKMPYSMETGIGRRLVRRIVEATADLRHGRIDLSDSQDMSIVATAQPPLPLTPASVMAAITALLLELGPYIDLLREALQLDHAPAAGSPPASSQEPPPELSSAP